MRYLFFSKALLAVLLMIFVASCEKPVLEEDNFKPGIESNKNGLVNVTFSNFDMEQTDFSNVTSGQSRSATAIQDLCGRISLALFDSQGVEKVKLVNQNKSDKEFGKISLSIPKGSYIVVVIAHNGEGNATISSPSKITFSNNKVTDTFYYYGELTVDADSNVSISMKRAVAMFRLVVKDKTPETVNSMKFYYTGGSSTFDASTGFGCVNSKQTETRSVENGAYSNESTYEIYTFPHMEEKKLKIEVSALGSASSTALYTRTFSNVPIVRNQITCYTGSFFTEDPGTGRNFLLSTTDEWTYDNYEY